MSDVNTFEVIASEQDSTPTVEVNEQNTETVVEEDHVVVDATNASDSVPVVKEAVDTDVVGDVVGQCKWFSDKLGYGFITIQSGENKGKDIFVHHSGIRPLNSNYKTLRKGEYVNFVLISGDNGLQAVNVTGIGGGCLMCDIVPSVKGASSPVPTGVPPPPPPRAYNDFVPRGHPRDIEPGSDGFKPVNYRADKYSKNTRPVGGGRGVSGGRGPQSSKYVPGGRGGRGRGNRM